MVETISLIILIAGAIGGLLRTLYQHEGRLVWPSVDFKRWKIKLGFLISMVIGAGTAYLADLGVVSAFPAIIPDDIYTAALFGLGVGFISLHLVNKLLGLKLEDPDVAEIGGKLIPTDEKNIHIQLMYQAIEKEASEYVERVKIIRGQTPGILKAVVAPKKGVDVKKAKMMVEHIINRIICPATQLYVRLPEEVVVNLSLVVEVMDGDDPEFTKSSFVKKITEALTDHIESLQPGESVYRSQIVHKVVGLDKYIKDVQGDKLTSSPDIVEGRIYIGAFQVAIAGNIDVTIVIRTIGSSETH
jgi:hypothetical protein